MAEHKVPQAVQNLLVVVVGNQWPEGNEGDLRALAETWHSAGRLVGGLAEGARVGTRQVDSAIGPGPALDAIDKVLHGLTDGDQAYLTTLAAVCVSLGDALEGMALEIETLRIEIITQLVILAAEIAIDLALAPLTFGASEAAAAGEIAATRISVTLLIRKTLIRLVAHLAESEFNQVGLDFFAQFIEICQHRRHGFDTNEIRTAAINGAVGGAVGFGMGGLGALLKGGIAKGAGSHLPGFGTTPRPTDWKDAPAFSADVLFGTGWGAASGAAEAAAQDAAFGGSGDTASGAENGAFSGFKGAGHGAFNPGDKLSLSLGHYIDGGLNHAWGKTPEPPQDHIAPTPPAPDHPQTIDLGATKITIMPDGSHDVTEADGSHVLIHPDGPTITSFPDGSHVVHNKDGSTVTSLPDGNQVLTLPDGSTQVLGLAAVLGGEG